MYQVNSYIPVEYAERVKLAMFKAGAGKIGKYEQCSFETVGKGQFRPCSGANPFFGNVGILELVDEIKVEMVCEKSVITNVIAALKAAHPYETPAYQIYELLDF